MYLNTFKKIKYFKIPQFICKKLRILKVFKIFQKLTALKIPLQGSHSIFETKFPDFFWLFELY